MSNVATDQTETLRRDAHQIFKMALQAVAPQTCIARHCHREGNSLHLGTEVVDLKQVQHIYVVGAGKATAAMAAALEEILGDRITAGRLNVKYGHTAELNRIQYTEAGHPVPDQNGVTGTQAILGLVDKAAADDLVICLTSGGGSALTPLPVAGVTLEDKQETTRILLACGATIHEINTLRKHLSQFKGGRLSRAAAPSRVFSLILSDVVGDDLDVIGSGPTVPDNSTFSDCLQICAKYAIGDQLPPAVQEHLQRGAAGEIPETPKADDPAFERTSNLIIGSNNQAVMAARRAAEDLGYTPLVLSTTIEGETREIAKMHAAIARESLASGHPLPPPACILSGGETTVTLNGDGKGGRNQEFVLAAAIELAGSQPVVVLSAGTDGNDGPTDAAGAVADGATVARTQALGLDPGDYLARNDAYHFFERLNDLVITGPTNTNVMDLRVMLVG